MPQFQCYLRYLLPENATKAYNLIFHLKRAEKKTFNLCGYCILLSSASPFILRKNEIVKIEAILWHFIISVAQKKNQEILNK